MINGRSRWLVAAAALAILVGGVAGDAVAKKKSKKIFKATVDGKRLKPRPASTVELAAGGGTYGFLATGTRIARGSAKTVLIGCAVVLDIQAFPFTSTDCISSYSETKARPFSMKFWSDTSVGKTEVTIDEYTPGVFISGRFRTLEPLPSSSPVGLPPVTLEGEFRGPVTLGDPSR